MKKMIFTLSFCILTFASMAIAAEEGFTPIFDGKTLDGWQGSTDQYYVKDGVIGSTKEARYLFTKKKYDNFIIRFEFKLSPGSNSGLGMRYPGEGTGAFVGLESQILDNSAEKYADKIQPYQYHGSIYGLIPAKRGFLKPVGEWNSEEIVLDGTKVRVTLNGHVIAEGDLSTIKEPMDHRDHPGLKNKTGFIALLGHGGGMWYRNLRVKEL
jgi:3-keto-disaccharide hydrolase